MNETQIQVLVVDDNHDYLYMMQRKLSALGYKIFTAKDANSALTVINELPIDIVLTDYRMPVTNGLELIRHLKLHFPALYVVMITGYPTIDGAIEAVKLGAEEYLSKPFTDEELHSCMNKAKEKVLLRRMSSRKAAISANTYGLVGNSQSMLKVYHSIRKSCTNSASVLIEGESGTGKELVARAIHYHSARNRSPFVPVNCSAIPETLLESELFGYMRGSFTGASETRAGYFITADGGTIFLDEIGEMSLSMQVKLLRVLQDKLVYMIGAKTPRKVNVRVITATNKDLKHLMAQGSFREDLYYRLNVLPIFLPPLRERHGDIVPLTMHFLSKFANESGLRVPEIDTQVLETFSSYHWPGNVRELENLVYRLLVLNEGNTISPADLPDYMKFSLKHGSNIFRSLAEVEKDHIQSVLMAVSGNKSKAAGILGIDRKTLQNKLKDT
jgi:DNA-binding NtrC family response regulator